MARLGLRAGEVAALTLDDIGWGAGGITIAGKGSPRERRLLPADVGETVAGYNNAWGYPGRGQPAMRRAGLQEHPPGALERIRTATVQIAPARVSHSHRHGLRQASHNWISYPIHHSREHERAKRS